MLKRLSLPPFLLTLFLCTSLAAQIDPYVTDVITTEGDTTVRVIITRKGWERISSRVLVEWLVVDHEGGFEEERMRIEIGRAGEVTCANLNDTALIAAQCFMKPYVSPKPMRDTIGNDVRYVVQTHVDGTVAESPWVTVRDVALQNADVLHAFGILDEYAESVNFDGSITISLFAHECCAGTKSYNERYQIDTEAKKPRLVTRTLFMVGLEEPHALLAVADSITTTSAMRLYLNTDRTVPDVADYAHGERDVWKHGVALVPNSTAWIVATKETDDGTWAFVIGRPVLTPDVRALFVSDNSKEPGTVAGWMKPSIRHK